MNLEIESGSVDLRSVRSQLEWVCEALIPSDPEGESLSALEAEVPDVYLPRALRIRKDLEPAFMEALRGLPKEPPADPLASLRVLGHDTFVLIGYLTTGAYWLNPEANRRLEYPGQEALTTQTDYDELAAITKRIQDRGARYVPTPSDAT